MPAPAGFAIGATRASFYARAQAAGLALHFETRVRRLSAPPGSSRSRPGAPSHRGLTTAPLGHERDRDIGLFEEDAVLDVGLAVRASVGAGAARDGEAILRALRQALEGDLPVR